MSQPLVLCYHAVSEDWTATLSTNPERLERQVSLLLERGYRATTFTEAVTVPSARKTFAVTFDDGFRSVFELGFPVLSRLGVPGTLFVPTQKIGSPGPMSWPGIDGWLGGAYERELVGTSWDELGELAAAGWEIGAHTRTHPRLTTLDDDRLTVELRGSREDCEQRLGRPCRSLAYPYGDVDGRVVAATGAAGYEAAAGLPGEAEPPDRLRWPRIGIYWYDDMRQFRRKVSPFLGRMRRSAAWPVAQRVRTRLRRR
jgi:peptidoglycan/xylan/chitin deacetylase (PgdA/CDA1 family)